MSESGSKTTLDITVPTEGVATVLQYHEGDGDTDVDRGLYAFPGDYGDPECDDVEDFRERVAHLVGKFFEREDGTVVELIGDFNGHAVYRLTDTVYEADAKAAEYARVYMVSWSRFEDAFDLCGDPRSTSTALRDDE